LLLSRGKTGDKGQPGPRGERGDKGERGEPGATIVGWHIDRPSNRLDEVILAHLARKDIEGERAKEIARQVAGAFGKIKNDKIRMRRT
jgi:hypothetical protein